MPQLTANSIQIEYETHGDPANPPLLLIMGLLVGLVTAMLLCYFDLRVRALSPAIAEARLQALQAGYIRLHLHVEPLPEGGRLVIEIEDSGRGFDLGKVLALELYTAAQALDLRRDMINAARGLADRADAESLSSKVAGAPAPGYRQALFCHWSGSLSSPHPAQALLPAAACPQA